ncbi:MULTISPECIES: CoA transferase [unclassified Massilia]|uniref:CaiB/BaiF CoA transferase family protein n=1 Tax=unclassified Massilia TaxID=2609279 RepID=UPI0017845BD1|nr:CoA transferase [Massilia sp. CFBP 13647]MBD8671961.1 CoA transferase [Massilia sp. CFBP 13721]
MTNKSSLPLAGVRVLDLSRVLAGPWCAMVLGDMGAEVIKVEHPQRGDDTRDWGMRVGDTETAYFNSVNRNKRSVCLDLKTPEGQQIARDLIRKSDVVIQNFKFGDIERLGLGYDELVKEQPGLIYCSITGYDRTGPEAARPGYDLVIQGEAGLMALNGEPTQPPLKFGVAAVDMMTGMYAAQGVLAALFDRERTGLGRHVGMALFDCGLMITAYYGLEALLRGNDPPRYGNAHPSIMPYGVYEAEDGPLVIAVGNNSQYLRFCTEVIERPDLASDERFKTNLERTKHREELAPQLRAAVAARKRKDLLERMSQVGIPCGEVAGLHEAMTSKRAVDSGLVTQMAHPVAGTVDVMASPYRFNGERLPVRSAPPTLGEGTGQVLAELLGLSEEKLQGLKERGVV